MGTDECWLIDLDGVVWLADDAIPGSAQALARLRDSGRRVVYFTNNSYDTRATFLTKFRRFGIVLDDADVAGAAEAAAELLGPGQRALVLGGPGIVEALAAREVEVIPAASDAPPRVDAVVVGVDWELDYPRLMRATRAVLAGARLIATNDDATYPTPDGPTPGGGAIVRAVAFASGVEPVVAGKPYAPAVAMVQQRFGEVGVVVGDRPATDGRFARALGAAYALVDSGVTAPGEVVEPEPERRAASLAALVDAELGPAH